VNALESGLNLLVRSNFDLDDLAKLKELIVKALPRCRPPRTNRLVHADSVKARRFGDACRLVFVAHLCSIHLTNSARLQATSPVLRITVKEMRVEFILLIPPFSFQNWMRSVVLRTLFHCVLVATRRPGGAFS
jgi:hypothetical protein